MPLPSNYNKAAAQSFIGPMYADRVLALALLFTDDLGRSVQSSSPCTEEVRGQAGPVPNPASES